MLLPLEGRVGISHPVVAEHAQDGFSPRMAAEKNTALRKMLDRVSTGELSVDSAMSEMRRVTSRDLADACVDLDRESRRGRPEAIFGAGKTTAQIIPIAKSIIEAGSNLIITRIAAKDAREVIAGLGEVPIAYHERPRMITGGRSKIVRKKGLVLVLCAGTSDLPVAEEALVTADALGSSVQLVRDVGVAGLHRLLKHAELLRTARVIVVVAGMEGALPSVVSGLTSAPVIAVPTSIGYGASFGGVSALLSMLNACSPGIATVNIDNGYGAGYLADVINELGERKTADAEPEPSENASVKTTKRKS